MRCPDCGRKLITSNEVYEDPLTLYCGYCAKYVPFGIALLEPGWLDKQIIAVQKEIAAWPAWMRDPRNRMSPIKKSVRNKS